MIAPHLEEVMFRHVLSGGFATASFRSSTPAQPHRSRRRAVREATARFLLVAAGLIGVVALFAVIRGLVLDSRYPTLGLRESVQTTLGL